MALIVGIDPSSVKLAIVGSTEARRPLVYTARYVLGKLSGPSACAEALWAMEDATTWLEDALPSDERIAFIESPLKGRGGIRSTVVQAYVNGVAQAWLTNQGYAVHLVNVSTWKSAVCGSGNASKEFVADWLRRERPRTYAVVHDDQDLIDAACINLYGQAVVRRRNRMGNNEA